jgi:NADP-dependent 3-hydroxy acid dehydrogenase YdfG
MARFANRTAVVTGGASGIGAATVRGMKRRPSGWPPSSGLTALLR